MKKSFLLKGAAIIALAGLLSKFLGFLYRIFLANAIGAIGMGLFQMVSPIFMLCVALSSGGIQIAISRFVAEESDNKSKCVTTLLGGLLLSGSLSVFLSCILYTMSDNLSELYFKDTDCAVLLKILAFSIPLNGFHSCIVGFFLGLKKTGIPAITQVLEQLFKLIALLLLQIYYIENNIEPDATIAVLSLLVSELAGSVFLIIAILLTKKTYISNAFSKKTPILILLRRILHSSRVLFSIAYILTLNRIFMSIFQSVEAYLLPSMLMDSGLSETAALSQYGVLQGMVMPVITFPSAIIGSISMVIMPVIANANVKGETKSLEHTTNFSIGFSCFCSIVCCGLFLIFSDFIGDVLFSNNLAGSYISILAWLAPFLYLSITFGSILHGLGKTKDTFIHNMLAIFARICFIYFLVPEIGITAYFWGMLISALITTFLHAFVISRKIPFSLPAFDCIIKPALWILAILGAGLIGKPILYYLTNWLL